GVQVPVEYDEEGNILDGYHRVRACLELGITDWPKVVRRGLSEAQKYEHAVQLNVARRQLSREEKQRAVARLREQGWTLERISKATKTPVSTIGRWVDELSQMGKLKQPGRKCGRNQGQRRQRLCRGSSETVAMFPPSHPTGMRLSFASEPSPPAPAQPPPTPRSTVASTLSRVRPLSS